MNRCFLLTFLIVNIFLSSCKTRGKVDSEILIPDIDESGVSHGYNYTLLGLLINFPWEYPVTKRGLEQNPYYKDGPIFELQKKGKLKFWFKSDYLENVSDTIKLSGDKTVIQYRRKNSSELKLAHVYEDGWWSYNAKDSSIVINFGTNRFNLSPIKGKLVDINIEYASIQYYDISGESAKAKRLNIFHY